MSSQPDFDAILALEKRVLESVDHVVYVSDWARRTVEETRGIHPRSSAVIWNGISDTTAGPPLSRQTLGLASDDFVIINVGTLEPRKNQLGLLDLFHPIAAREPRAKLLLVGDGPDRPRLHAKINALGLQDRVLLLGARRDVPLILGIADLYLHYATLENCPVTLLEAARASLPLAATPAGGVPEILTRCGGIELNTADIPASSDKILSIIHDADLRQKMGHRSRHAFERHFTRDAMTDAYLNLLKLGQEACAS